MLKYSHRRFRQSSGRPGISQDGASCPGPNVPPVASAVNGWKRISKILITGGNGFIGSHLAEKLLARGDSVALLDLKFNANTRFLDCEKIRGDIRDYETVRKAADEKNAVFHLAAVSRVACGQDGPFKCWLTNQVGTLNVLEACTKAES